MSPFTEISILLLEGIIKKFPILGYIPKNDEKENLVHKGLNDFEKRGKTLHPTCHFMKASKYYSLSIENHTYGNTYI